jgi:hypothetical protein
MGIEYTRICTPVLGFGTITPLFFCPNTLHILNYNLRGKRILNDLGQGFPSEFEIFADAIARELETFLCF